LLSAFFLSLQENFCFFLLILALGKNLFVYLVDLRLF